MNITDFWNAYLAILPADAPRPARPEAWGFGDGAAMADELGELVRTGVKTATCSSLWEIEAEGEAVPVPGDLSIILDGAGRPLCIIETTGVAIRPYNEVDAQFAWDEGEGDRSLAFWRQAHRRFFSRTLPATGRSFAGDMPLVCERFRVIYP